MSDFERDTWRGAARNRQVELSRLQALLRERDERIAGLESALEPPTTEEVHVAMDVGYVGAPMGSSLLHVFTDTIAAFLEARRAAALLAPAEGKEPA